MATLLAPSNAFGTAPAETSIAFGTDATKTRAEFFTKLWLPMEAALDGINFGGINVLCSDAYWTALFENKAIKDTYLNTQQAADLRKDPRETVFFGGINFERHRGSSAIKIPTGKAIAVPTGVAGLFIQAFGPDDTLDSVGAGSLGSPYYLRAFDLDDNKGWRIRAQTHCVMLCTRPTAVLPLAFS